MSLESLQVRVKSQLDKIDKEDNQIQSFITEDSRFERVENHIDNLFEIYPDEKSRPPLFGLTVGVKDIFRTAELPTKGGSKLPESCFEGEEAISVSQLKEAGAIVIGKTVTTEFAYFQPGPTRNPLNIEHTPGGSSSGSAAAVAAGFCDIALGTQTIGSISRPASYCGVIGYKPSYSRISAEGVIPFSKSVDHIGFFIKNYNYLPLTASVLCDDWKVSDSDNSLPVIAIPEGPYLDQADKDNMDSFRKIVDVLKEKGITIIQLPAYENIDVINNMHRQIASKEFAETHEIWYAEYPDLYSKHSIELIEEGLKVSPEDFQAAMLQRMITRKLMEYKLKDAGADLWLSPATIGDAPHGISSTGSPIMNLPWTYVGLPTITFPGSTSKNNLPYGLQFAGRYWDDEKFISDVEKIYRLLWNN
jgi:Asp-tRNA(Asn)/Glu-tRNA(Gln) amidotransferase A subunit family amidase